jgi:hypothetical protein
MKSTLDKIKDAIDKLKDAIEKAREEQEIRSQSDDEFFNLKDKMFLIYAEGQLKKLDELFENKELKEADIKFRKSCITFLEELWNEIQGTDFSYTAMPISYLTVCSESIAKALQESDKENELTHMVYLIPGFNNTWPNKKEFNISSSFEFKDVIFSDDYKTVISIKYLAELSLKALQKIFEEEQLFTPAVQERLKNHSESTTEWFTVYQDWQTAKAGTQTIKLAIEELIKALKKGGAHGGHGGTEEEAGSPALLGISRFKQFFNMLPEKQQTRLSKCTTAENTYPFGEIFDILKGKVGKGLASCVETNASHLQKIILNPKNTLILASVPDFKDLESFEKEFNVQQEALQCVFEKDDYQGQEFYQCVPEEALSDLIKQITKFDDLISFIQQFSLNLDGFLNSEVGKTKLYSLIEDGEQLGWVLGSLNETQCEWVWKALGDTKITELIKDGEQLGWLLGSLNETQCEWVWNALGDTKITELIKDGEQLHEVLRFLNEMQREWILKALGDTKITELIKDGKRLGRVLQLLNETQCEWVWKTLGDTKITELIKDGQQLGKVLDFLNETQCRWVWKVLGDTKITELIKDGDQLGKVLASLDEMKRGWVLKALGDTKIVELIKDGSQLGRVLSFLNETQFQIVWKLLNEQGKIAEFIKDDIQLFLMLIVLAKTQRERVSKLLGDTKIDESMKMLAPKLNIELSKIFEILRSDDGLGMWINSFIESQKKLDNFSWKEKDIGKNKLFQSEEDQGTSEKKEEKGKKHELDGLEDTEDDSVSEQKFKKN